MLRLHVDAKGTETTIVSSSKLIVRNVLRSLYESIADLFGRLDLRAQWVGHAHKCDLLDSVGVCPDRLANFLIHFRLVLLRSKLDQKVSRIDLEQRR